MPPTALAPDDKALADFCRAHGIRQLSIFGSTIKGTAQPDSDLDLLVEFEPDRVPGLLGMAKLEEELSALMGGKTIDLRTAGDLSRYFRDDIIRTAQTRYAA
ncbi:MAG: nucleotidyltransferase [Rhodocyclaceae bacterium]|nr:MAG: nucleotidyltransferase [Rhodocyclaceae bacterium]